MHNRCIVLRVTNVFTGKASLFHGWHLFGLQGEERFKSPETARLTLPSGETIERTCEEGEWTYYVTENRGLLMADGTPARFPARLGVLRPGRSWKRCKRKDHARACGRYLADPQRVIVNVAYC